MANKTSNVNKKRDDLASTVAELHGVSPDYVRKVRRGERENEEIMATIMDVLKGKNKLIQEVKRLIPLEVKAPKRAKTTLGMLQNQHQKGGQCPQKNLFDTEN